MHEVIAAVGVKRELVIGHESPPFAIRRHLPKITRNGYLSKVVSTVDTEGSGMSNYHVTKPKDSEVWRVVKEGAERASATAPTQSEAERIAKDFAGNSGGGEVRIHSPKGPIRDSDTVAPGNDPRSIRDTKH
jgi:hypothetical protein